MRMGVAVGVGAERVIANQFFLKSSDLRKVYLNLAPYYNYHKKSMLISCVLLLSVVNR